MASLKEVIMSDDFKKEKHVPVIELPAHVKKGEKIKVTVSVGKEIPHPNTTEHHISWIELYFLPTGEKYPYVIGKYEFQAHGASTQGPNTSTIYSDPEVTVTFRTEKSGTVIAYSHCNIHGLWSSQVELKLE
ncbi:class II SORL domain-containing protein [Athalassotoga sp.]|uniref:class II SORL domain-containing protein n=1 Tax=Athalassotoga sp. TaxID=2022597 RepID=UPI003D02181B